MPPRENYAAGDDVEHVRIESEDFHRLFVATKDADAVLYRGLRKALREAAGPMVAGIRAQIDLIPSSGKSTGVRAALKAKTRASISTSARSAGVRIVTSPRRLPPGKRVLAKSLNKAAFRHPVFGNREEWVNQSGRPYFGATINAHTEETRRRVQAVMEDMSETLRKATNG